MITIRSSNEVLEPALIGLEATLTTPLGAYEFSSSSPIADGSAPAGGGLFGAISWPRSRFQIQPGTIVEQQMFVSHSTADIAISWELRGRVIPARLVVRPHFAGCALRSFRDRGFHFEFEDQGGRLVWVPNVCGPKLIADTNGQYVDEPRRLSEIMGRRHSKVGSLVAPGRFEFDLNHRPSVLIFSSEGRVKSQHHEFVGSFLASLIQRALDNAGFEPAPVCVEELRAA
jgi:hypothetical protein